MEGWKGQVGKRKHVVSVLLLAIFMSLGNIKIEFLFFFFFLVTSKIAEMKPATGLNVNMFRDSSQHLFGM